MGKDGAGGGSYSDEVRTVRVVEKSDDKTVYDLHIQTLTIIDAEMQRLHNLIQRGDEDVDTSQEQLGTLHEELIRLSTLLSEKVCE